MTGAATQLGRFVDRNTQQVLVKLGPGDHYVTMADGEVITTVLGSCVAACVRDPVARVGGMNHFMLPSSDNGVWGGVTGSLRFGNFAMERMVNDILKRGGRRDRLEAKLFGGGDVLGSGAPIGHRNATFAETYLNEEGIFLAAHTLRGHCARRVQYFPLSGRARVLELPMLSQAEVAAREARYREELARNEAMGEIELF